MKTHGLAIALGVLIVLGGALYWSNKHPQSGEASKLASDAAPSILKLDPSAITEVQIKKKDAETIELARSSAGDWQITQPQAYRADQTAVSSMLSTVSSLNSQRLVEDKASDLKAFGLDNPNFEVDLAEKDNKSQKLLLGDSTPATSGVYAMLAGDPRVFTVASYDKTSVDKTVNDLRAKRLFDFGYSDPSKIELHNGAKSYLLIRGTSGSEDWWSNGKKMNADNVEMLISDLRDLSAARFPDSGFANPTIEAIITSDEGKRVEKIQVAKSGNHYIAKRESEPSLYELDVKNVDDLLKAADEIKPAAK